jgi:alkylhydroperoxidase family enzyme
MAQLLGDIEWEEPLNEPVVIPTWEKEAKERYGGASDMSRRLAPVPWLSRAFSLSNLYPINTVATRLADLIFLVVSQENSCRYCYGAARAHMRILGYSDRAISQIEREMQLAELDEKDQAFIRFCRSLARSNPRPARAQREELMRLGFTEHQVAESAFLIANYCLGNRVATFIAVPPALGYERMGRSILGRLLRPMLAQANRRSIPMPADFMPGEKDPFAHIVRPLAGLPAAYMLHKMLTEAFESPVLSRRIKLLMFAVVARMLECSFCIPESRRLLLAEGFDEAELESTLSALASPKLDAKEAAILAWVRETVRYQPAQIQKRTRALADTIGLEATLEAVGVAGLANATVRIAMLLA